MFTMQLSLLCLKTALRDHRYLAHTPPPMYGIQYSNPKLFRLVIQTTFTYNNNLYLERVTTYVKPYGLVSDPLLIFPRALTCK